MHYSPSGFNSLNISNLTLKIHRHGNDVTVSVLERSGNAGLVLSK